MAQTAAEKQAAYRERLKTRTDSEVSVSSQNGTATLPPEDPQWIAKKERSMGPAVAEDPKPPGVSASRADIIEECAQAVNRAYCKYYFETKGPLIDKMDEILKRLDTLHDLLKHAHPLPEPVPGPADNLTKCMQCGDELPPTETPRFVRELCHQCVWRKST